MKIKHINTPAFHPGFLGQGHTAAAIVNGSRFRETDPFLLLMDDRLDLPGGEPVGGPHPHAGFETVTLVLQGDGRDWETGSLELMTAGRGIVHTEEITARTRMHILQLWLALPPELRNAEPRVQKLAASAVPVYQTSDATIRVYSGSSQGFTSPLHNLTGLTLLEIRLAPEASVTTDIPADQNGFVYVIDGNATVAESSLRAGQVGWLERGGGPLLLQAGAEEVRLVVYAGHPHGAEVVSHGPFVADSEDDIRRLYREYRQGLMPHVNHLPENRQIHYDNVSA